MRLWSQDLIKHLPSKKDYKGCSNQLGGQHTEIRMILGKIKKCGKVNHSTVNYVNNYPIYYLYTYGLLVIDEMTKRGFNINPEIIKEYTNQEALSLYAEVKYNGKIIYPEHNNNYLQECLLNLKNKGIEIEV
jgi:uncharacterized protein (TIGR02328 family)